MREQPRARGRRPAGDGTQKRLRVGVLRIARRRPPIGPAFDHFAVLHHRNEIAHLRGDAEVVCDEHDGETEVARATRPAASAPAPVRTHRAPKRARRRSAPRVPARARARARYAGAARRRTRAGSGRSRRDRARPARTTSFARASASARGVPWTIEALRDEFAGLASRIE